MISVQPPSGFRDFLNNEARRRLKLIHRVADVYQSFGFSPLETPVLENLDVLLGGGGGEENEKLIFKIMRRGAKLEEALESKNEAQIAEYGLRFDLTVPLSRAVAAHRGEIKLPWKVFHIGPVWRADRPQKGRFREFIQCDVDIVGAKGIAAELEVIQAVVSALEQLGVSGFELRLNDRRLMQATAEKLGFTGEKLSQFAIILDKKGKLEDAEILAQMEALLGQPLPAEIKQLVQEKLTLEDAAAFHPGAAADLTFLMKTLKEIELPLSKISFDPSLARGMGYYTGPVFELRHPSAGYSFGGGGRYDQLIGRFAGQSLPACGFSLGFERLTLLMAEMEKETHADPKSHVLFIPSFAEELRGKVARLARELRREGMEVDVYPDQAKLKNQFKYASDSGYQWVLIAGPEEWEKGLLKLKDFSSGKETEIRLEDAVSELKAYVF